jgi:hypothetical protein
VDPQVEWHPCRLAAGALARWYDETTRGEEARVADPPLVHVHGCWALSVALWKATAADGVPVAEVGLSAPLGWLGGPERLWSEPLPPDPEPTADPPAAGPSAAGGRPWDRVRQVGAGPVTEARRIVEANAADADRRGRMLGDVPRGGPAPSVTIGVRLRDLASREWIRRAAPPHLTRQVDQLAAELRGGVVWLPTDTEREAARLVLPTVAADPDYPPMPEAAITARPAWLQRVYWVVQLRPTVHAVIDAVGLTAESGFGLALAGVARFGLDLDDVADELEAAWVARPPGQSLADWERQHVPLGLREEVLAMEESVARLGTLLAALH